MIRQLIAILIGAFILAGCNTIKGAGRDLERSGEKIQDKAERSR